MSKKIRRMLVGITLVLAPVLAVQAVKRSDRGAILSTPSARQMGDPGAKLVIVEYSDFQCPACANVQPAIHQFMELYKGKIRLAYKYYPLTNIHRNAMPAARAAECAARQKKFWPYQDKLFADQNLWANLADATTHFVAIAGAVGLDAAAFEVCRADPAIEASIQQDAAEAVRRQVASTPTFFIGETRMVGGLFASEGARTIERELRR